MKFILSSVTLLQKLNLMVGVVEKTPVIPILENFLFEIETGTLKVTASDLQTTITAEIDIELCESGKFALPARILMDTLKHLPEQPIQFNVDLGNFSIEIKTDIGLYKIAGEDPSDFPIIHEFPDNGYIEITGEILSRAIDKTLFACSNDELRPALTGVHMNINSGVGIKFASTDGHILVTCERNDITISKDSSIIVPGKSLLLLKKIIGKTMSVMHMNHDSENAFFHFNEINMVCRLFDEKYPNYSNVIPKDNNKIIFIDRMDLLNSIKRVGFYTNKTLKQIRLKLTDNKLKIIAEDFKFSNEAREEINCEYQGEEIEIGFNFKLMLDILKNHNSKKLKIELSTPNKAALFMPDEDLENENLLMLLMPIMLGAKTY